MLIALLILSVLTIVFVLALGRDIAALRAKVEELEAKLAELSGVCARTETTVDTLWRIAPK